MHVFAYIHKHWKGSRQNRSRNYFKDWNISFVKRYQISITLYFRVFQRASKLLSIKNVLWLMPSWVVEDYLSFLQSTLFHLLAPKSLSIAFWMKNVVEHITLMNTCEYIYFCIQNTGFLVFVHNVRNATGSGYLMSRSSKYCIPCRWLWVVKRCVETSIKTYMRRRGKETIELRRRGPVEEGTERG